MFLYVLPRGGFGNVMFNFLIGYSLAKKYGLNLLFIKNYHDKREKMESYNIFKGLNYTNSIVPGVVLIREPSFFHFNIELGEYNYLLDGYFQSYKYSDSYIPEIREFLKLPKDIRNATALHVRRGDYLALQNFHPVQSDEYYKKALELTKPAKLLVFSDDIEFVSNWDLLKIYSYQIIDKDVESSFIIMTQCENFIISNSSLSLTAFLLRANKNAKICLPNRWFGPDGPKYSIDDLVQLNENVYVL